MSKKVKGLGFAFVTLLIAVTLAVGFFYYQFLVAPAGSDKTEIVFDVAPGSSFALLSQRLQDQGLVRNAFIFSKYARFKNLTSKLKVGEYSLNKTMSPDEILATLISGRSIARRLTIAEGLNIYDIGEIIEKAEFGKKEEFLKLVKDKDLIKSLLGEELNSLEGYLYPETYMITKYENIRSIITQMVKRFLSVWNDVEMTYKPIDWSRNKVVTFASIVEKETGAGFERPLVSSVFHNRLKKNMKLQTDPTVLYGMAIKQGKMPFNISKKDLLTPTSHNTYTNYGLPPTPISNPGKDALIATLRPAQSNYLYFVSKNDGTHVFSESLVAHNAAVKTFQMDPKAREGKSWRDLKKTQSLPVEPKPVAPRM